jgi:hypothetical protein
VIRRQKIALWTGGMIMIAMAIVPPWYFATLEDGEERPHSIRYGWLVAPPAPEVGDSRVGARVAFEILLVQWAVVAGLTLGTILALREGRGRIRSARRRRSARAGDIRRGRPTRT